MSINLPISEQVVGPRATRTTHPLVLDHFRKFFSAVVGKPIEVDNPFIWKTKGDVVRSIVDHDCSGLIKHTVSCTRVYDITKLYTHCGCCSQCLDRRFAVLAANAAAHDPVDMYKVELLAGPRDKDKDQTMAESYVRTALELREMSDFAFFDRFGGETARVLTGFPSLSADEVGRLVFELHQRHAQAIGDVLKVAVEGHSAELVRGRLPPSSILMMTVSPSRAPTLATIGKRADSLKTWIDEEKTKSASGEGKLPKIIDIRERSQLPRRKSQPALERARGIIKELYPGGVPNQVTEPNVNLCRRVSAKLKESHLPSVSDDTILRAACRRK